MFVLGCKTPPPPTCQFSMGEIAKLKVSDTPVIISDIHCYPSGINYSIKYTDKLGELRRGYVAEFELQKVEK